ncbi:hypothetical protein SUGI_0916580 [Cryptomeria japonica]|nr:hypothetical protein SUGI_0916580 [Cryptomeria japonica]
MPGSNCCAADSTISSLPEPNAGPLYRMGSLLSSLPNKRGLSRFYAGKSQTFSCLADVKCVEQLAKPVKNRAMRKSSSTATAVE